MSEENASPAKGDATEEAPALPPEAEPSPLERLRRCLPRAMAAREQEYQLSMSMLAEKYVAACEAEKDAQDAQARTLLEMRALRAVMAEERARG
jgi:hypothetical protein